MIGSIGKETIFFDFYWLLNMVAATTPAVSVRSRDAPKVTLSKLADSAIAISASENPPSGPIKIRAG